MKPIIGILSITAATVIVGALYYLNMVKAPAVPAPQELVPATTTTTGNETPGNSNETGIANPASVYCVEQGGESLIVSECGGQGCAERGVCVMPGGTECDEWEFFRTKVCAATSTVPGGESELCGRENCHGLDIKCGSNVADMCTMEYQLGDKCLRLVNCGIEDGVCQQIPNAAFDACKTCVQKCGTDFANDQAKMFDCESKCE